MGSDGITGPNKLRYVLLPLVSVWIINPPSPLRTMNLLVREGRMFRENELSLPTEIKMEEMERSVEMWKRSKERKNKIPAPL